MQPVVNLCSFSASPADLDPTAQANARLIAAAPDLLAACETFAEWLEREERGSGVNRDAHGGEAAWREWYEGNLALCVAQQMAREAIDKATGK